MFAQSGQRAPTGDCTMHLGQIRSPHRPQPKFEAVSGWRKQVLSKASFVIGESGYRQIMDIYRDIASEFSWLETTGQSTLHDW